MGRGGAGERRILSAACAAIALGGLALVLLPRGADDPPGPIDAPPGADPTALDATSGATRGATAAAGRSVGTGSGLLDVHVRTADGEPVARATLVLIPLGADGTIPAGFTRATASARVRAATDADGRARMELPGAGADDAPLELHVMRNGLTSAVRRIEPPIPASLTIELPPGGRVEVEVVDEAGEYRHALPIVHLRRVDEPGSGLAVLPKRDLAVFEPVELGGAYELCLQQQEELLSRRVVTPGPRLPAQTVRVRLEVLPRPRVVGRAVDAEGQPLSGELLARVLAPGSPAPVGQRGSLRASVAATGEFELVLARHEEPRELALGLPGGRGARRSIPALERGDRVELGEVVFDLLPLAVAGRVLDAHGRPAAGARVRVFEQARTGRLRSLGDALTSGSDGSFERNGRVDPLATLVIHADLPGGGEASARRVAAGTRALELRLSGE